MTILLLVCGVAAFFFGIKLGRDNGIESALSFQRQKVHDGMAPDSAFQKTYGVPGMYLSDTNPKLDGMPLIAISSANFLELIVLQKVADDTTSEEIERLMNQLADSYLIENGMSLKEIEIFRLHFPRDPIRRAFPYKSYKTYVIDDWLKIQESALSDSQVKVASSKPIQTASPVDFYLNADEDSDKVGQHSEERQIEIWFETDARKLLLIALADRLNISETATAPDIARLEQIATQTRENFMKLGSPEPIHFDERVKKALNWALDSTESGNSMTEKLRNKLNEN